MFKLDYRTGRKLVWGSAAIVALYVDVTATGGISFWAVVYGLGTAVVVATFLALITKR
jgi:uncharacterized protein YbjQ (UPF0145 family)